MRRRESVARTAFVGEPPMTLDVEGQPFAPPVVKMTKEERAAMTSLQKAQVARARAERALRLAARLEATAK